MGLFDSILGAVTQNVEASGQASPVMGAVSGLLAENGGLQGLESKFTQGGLGGIFSSWVGTEANQAISGGELQRVVGSEQINALATKLGVDPTQASNILAQYLGHVVDKLTPNGVVDPAVNHQETFASMLPSLLQSLGGRPPATPL